MESYHRFAEKERPRLVEYIRGKYSFDSCAEDVVQEALIEGLKHDRDGRFVSEKHRLAVVYQTARRRAIDELRRIRRRPYTGVDEQIDELPDSSETEIAQTQEFIAGYDVEQIQAALAKLPPKLYEILYLAYYEGLTNPEIARRLGLRKGQVASRKDRGKRRLGGMLGDQEHE